MVETTQGPTVNTNYDLLGSMPVLERFRDTLGSVIEAFENELDVDKKADAAALIVLCARHFYGIDTDGLTMFEIIDQLESFDESMKFS